MSSLFLSPEGRSSPQSKVGLNRLVRPLAELKQFFASWIADLRGRRDIPNLMDAEAAQEIAEEAIAERQQFGQAAFTARVEDDEGLALVDRILADGQVTAAEVPLLRRARRHFLRSREIDHQLSEVAQ